jgi:hypothetical protein
MVREQFLATLPEDAQVAVIERQPKDCEEAGRVACKYLQARSMSIGQGTINGIYCTDILVDTGASA